MIKESIHQEDTTIGNIYAPNIRAAQYIKQILTDLQAEIDSSALIVGDLNTSLSTMDRSSRQKINKEILDLNDTLEQMDLKDVYRKFHPIASEYTFCSSTHGTFSRLDHLVDHKTNLRTLKSYQVIFFNHNGNQ